MGAWQCVRVKVTPLCASRFIAGVPTSGYSPIGSIQVFKSSKTMNSTLGRAWTVLLATNSKANVRKKLRR